MSSIEHLNESPSLHIDSLWRKQGPVSVYFAHVGQESYLFYFYAEPTERTMSWLPEIVRRRTLIHDLHLPMVIPHGDLPEGGFGWSVRLGASMSLREIWDTEPHNPLRSIRLVMQAVDAVSALQAQGGIHGDIRAENFWVCWDDAQGEMLSLVGAQLGLWVDSERWQESDLSLDVAECLSPEVAAGGLPTVASDVYGLGVMLFRALHGHVPFVVENAWEMAALQATMDLQRPDLSVPMHEELWSVIEACLQKNPLERITVAELQARLLPFVRHQKPIFVDMELTDPESIAEPTPIAPKLDPIPLSNPAQWTSVKPRSLQDLAYTEPRKSSAKLEEPSTMTSVDTSSSTDLNVRSVEAESEVEEETQEFTLKVEREHSPFAPLVAEITENQRAQEEVTQKATEAKNVLPAPVHPLKILVGGTPMPSVTAPLNAEHTDSTNNIPVISWLEDSSERVIEAPVEYHLTNPRGLAASKKLEDTAPVEKARRSRSQTQSNTGVVQRPQSSKGLPQQAQFVIFMTLSSVITVLLLKIAEKLL